MYRRSLTASAIVVVLAAAFLTGSGVGSSAAAARKARRIPAGLANAIHARLGAGAMRSSSAASYTIDPWVGFSVAVSEDGTTALVGAPQADGGRGAAYIFHASGAGSWSSSGVPTATLTHKHLWPAAFGSAVAFSAEGTTAFVEAPEFGGKGGSRPAVYVFHVSAEDAWASSSAPTATLTVARTAYALASSPDGTTLVVGEPFYLTAQAGQPGAAAVFHVSSEDAWASTSTPTATLTNAGQSASDTYAGFSVAISGDGTTVLLSDGLNPDGSGADVYHVSAEDAWTSQSTPTAILSDANRGPDLVFNSGTVALSADGTLAFIGLHGHNSVAGEVDVFHSSGEAAWASTSTPTATLTAGTGAAHALFGWTVAVSGDGTTALVTDSGVNAYRGAAYIFRASGEGAWASSSAPTATLANSGAHANDDFLTKYAGPSAAAALSTDGATVLVGAPGVDKRTGAADVFNVAESSSWATSSTPNAVLTDTALAACTVPKLKGLKLNSTNYLHSAGWALAVARCRLGKVTKVHSKTKKGRVLVQSPKPGKRLIIGAKVAVRVGK